MVLLLSDSQSDYGPVTRNVCIAMIILAGVAILLRFLSRRVSGQSVTCDDWLMLLALPFSWLLSIDIILAVNYGGLGRKLSTLDRDTIMNFLKIIFASQFFYTVSLTLIKFSIVAFYRRLFWASLARWRMYMIVGFIVAWSIASIFTKIFVCNPVSGYWNRFRDPPPTCLSEYWVFIGLAIPNILADIILLLVPLKPIWNLQVSRVQKLELTSVFTVTGFVTIISTLRLVMMIQAVNDGDMTRTSSAVSIFEIVETSLSMLLASIPSMKPLFRYIKNWQRRRAEKKDTMGVPTGEPRYLDTLRPEDRARLDHMSQLNAQRRLEKRLSGDEFMIGNRRSTGDEF